MMMNYQWIFQEMARQYEHPLVSYHIDQYAHEGKCKKMKIQETVLRLQTIWDSTHTGYKVELSIGNVWRNTKSDVESTLRK